MIATSVLVSMEFLGPLVSIGFAVVTRESLLLAALELQYEYVVMPGEFSIFM
jgi:hypothetical protein